MKKLKFAFKTLSNEEINAKNYDLTICENLFGDSVFVLKDGNEIKYVKMKSVRSVLTGKNEIVLTDMTDNHIVGIVEDAFNENNVHNRTFISEIESNAIVDPTPQPDPEPEESAIIPDPNPKDVPEPEKEAVEINIFGDDYVFTGHLLQLTADVSGVIWSSSDDSVATVDSNGVVVGVSVGDATIIAHSEDPAYHNGYHSITVAPEPTLKEPIDDPKQNPVAERETVEINISGSDFAFVGDTIILTSDVSDITWSSSDDNVATVDSNGVVTCVSAGIVVIAAHSENPEYRDGIHVVTVELPPIKEVVDDLEPVSDEFTYTKEPGKIKKVFLHLYDGSTLETFRADSESNHYVDADGVVRRELLYDTNSLSKIGDNTVDIVVAVDVNVTRDSYISDDIINALIADTDAHERIFAQIAQDMSNRHVTYEFWSDLNDSSSNRITINSAEDVRTLLDELAHNYRHGYVYLRDGKFNPSEFHVMGSDKVFNSDIYNVDHLDVIGWDDFNMHSTNIGDIIDSTSPDSSTGFQGIYIIQKALETGRALDIGVNLSEVGWDYPIIKRYK